MILISNDLNINLHDLNSLLTLSLPFTVYTLHYTAQCVHVTLYTLHYTMYCVHFSLDFFYTVQCIVPYIHIIK